MRYITATGNLANTPELRTGDKGSYCYATVAVSDRLRDKDGNYTDGPTTYYNVSVSGKAAENLVAAAEASGNIRVTFSGRYTTSEYQSENGTRIQHNVRADEIAASFRGQNITVTKGQAADQADDNFGDDTPF